MANCTFESNYIIPMPFGVRAQLAVASQDLYAAVSPVLLAACLLVLAFYLWEWFKPKVYVLDFSVFNPPKDWNFPKDMIRTLANVDGRVQPEHVDFMCRLAERTGMGDETAVLPESQLGDVALESIELSRTEFRRTCLTTAQALFDKTGVKPSQVNFVITNSSLFNPTPSLSAIVMNHFKMGPRTQGYSLGGMGCSAGVIALNLAKDLLRVHPNSCALIISHENISGAIYAGRDPSMLISNVLFRCNGSAVLVTNKPQHARRAKYLIRDIVCTNMAADDEAYGCIQLTEDDDKNLGIRLKKELISVGVKALRENMTALGPLVLPLNEKLKFAASYVVRKAAKSSKLLTEVLPKSWVAEQYVPDFKKAFEFFCIHTGGRGIIDGLEKQMGLSRSQVEPSRAVLYRFGNVSSTSVWYDLAYIEAFQGVSRDDRVWQLAFGSGFKFNSSVLVAQRGISDAAGHPAWQGFSPQAMWAELDKLEAAARAGRAAKAARLAAEKAAADKAAAERVAAEAAAAEKAAVKAAADGVAVVETGSVAAVPDAPDALVAPRRDVSGRKLVGVQVHVQLKDATEAAAAGKVAAGKASAGGCKVQLQSICSVDRNIQVNQ